VTSIRVPNPDETNEPPLPATGKPSGVASQFDADFEPGGDFADLGGPVGAKAPLVGRRPLPPAAFLPRLRRVGQLPAGPGPVDQAYEAEEIAMTDPSEKIDRRGFVGEGFRVAGAIGLGGLSCFLAGRKGTAQDTVWQIDPEKCVACGNCATYCVLDVSAVKCFHDFAICGYCELCTGYFEPEPYRLDSGAENQLCPTGAIIRTFIEDPYHEYTIDKPLCIGCGKCVKGCSAFGNGSLYLQVSHDLCLGCNECSIAVACPSQAFKRVPAAEPYLFKHQGMQDE